ncbi:Hsp70 family protein [Mycolicibacterium sp. XJ1819]
MFTQHATPGHCLGLSVGATNLAGTRNGQAALTRRCEATRQGQRLSGFVDRVGDPVPMVAADGSAHRAELLLAEALDDLAQSLTAGVLATAMAVAVPAHWRASAVDVMRRAMRGGVPVVSDATAALTALSAAPGLPTRGVIVLADFGGSGTSITLANASSNYALVGETVRFADFSGDQLDQALLRHVIAGSGGLDTSQADPSGTAMVGSLTALREECRRAKERLSSETVTSVSAEGAAHRTEVRVTRAELEELMHEPLTALLAALDDILERYGVPSTTVTAVATVGGGARIPWVTQRLSEHLRTAVVTTPRPHLCAAEGAALIGLRSRVVETGTTITPAPGLAAATTGVGELAWSQDETEDELPYVDPLIPMTDARPALAFGAGDRQAPQEPPRRAPLALFVLSAAALLTVAVYGVFQLTSASSPIEAATTVAPSPTPAAPASSPAPPAPQAPEVTTVVVQPAQRSLPLRPQAPVTAPPPAQPTPHTPPPPTPEPTVEPTGGSTPEQTPPPAPPDPSEEPTEEPTEPTTPDTPPIDPGPGDGGSADDETPPIDPGNGAGG